ncbi:MAG: amidohydrolase family protein, partial [Clostridia bacterium]|nr:amidohydrolase family protein [Clostridia bacterium]
LGTDSVASNNNLDMIEEMKFFALLNKGFKNDPTVITPKQAVLAATLNGAKAQGRTDCGALKLGNKADLCVFDLNRANFQPIHDVLNNLVYAASGGDIVLTMADGKVLYENGKYTTIDLEKTVYEVNAAKARILSEL